VEVDDLVRFVQKPVRTFLRRRLGIAVGRYDDEIEDVLPVELDDLEKYAVGSRLLETRLRGATPQAAVDAEFARGLLPPLALGQAVVEEVWPKVDAVFTCARDVLSLETEPESVDVRAVLADGRTLSGTVSGVAGDVLRSVSYATLGPQHRIAAWVRLLALTAAHPERPFRAITVGRRQRQASVAWIRPLGDDPASRRATALQYLAVLADLMDRGLREPLPLACKTSHAYAEAVRNGVRRARAGGRAGVGLGVPLRQGGQGARARAGLRWRASPSATCWNSGPRPDERDWHPTDGTRFGVLARRLWTGVFAHETVETR
jgi:exodeoxyribonuclease V gamma subunit